MTTNNNPMNPMTITEFCDKHHACNAGRQWALKNCASMQEVWNKCERYDWMIWLIKRPNVLTHRELVQFALWSAQQVQHLMTGSRSLSALSVVERYLRGEATQEDCRVASEAADADYVANYCAAAADYAAAAAAATAAYVSAANYYVDVAAATAAYGTAAAVAAATAYGAAAYSAAVTAARKAQINWLRENTKPNFA